MDPIGMVHLNKIRYDELLRQAEQRRRITRSPRFNRLPKLMQALILILS